MFYKVGALIGLVAETGVWEVIVGPEKSREERKAKYKSFLRGEVKDSPYSEIAFLAGPRDKRKLNVKPPAPSKPTGDQKRVQAAEANVKKAEKAALEATTHVEIGKAKKKVKAARERLKAIRKEGRDKIVAAMLEREEKEEKGREATKKKATKKKAAKAEEVEEPATEENDSNSDQSSGMAGLIDAAEEDKE